MPENSQSDSEAMALLKLRVADTPVGASAEVTGIFELDPMCM